MPDFYARPLILPGPRPAGALPLAGGALWFREVELLSRDAPPRIVAAGDCPAALLDPLTAPRAAFAGLPMDRPHVMGIVNVTPDSFSDGGRHEGAAGIAHGRALTAAGATILDIGGESTRPGAADVPEAEEAARVLPVIEALAGTAPLSIDTRKPGIARAATRAGAAIWNDVTALGFAPESPAMAAETGAALCLMHSIATPATMQDDPRYADVLLDVYDALAARIAVAEGAGVPRTRICIDPGIGFGKTLEHNLALTRGLALFHGLGCPILYGASRKRFIGAITGAEAAADRDPGSHAVMSAALSQGAQIVRVHDVPGAMQTLRIWSALNAKEQP